MRRQKRNFGASSSSAAGDGGVTKFPSSPDRQQNGSPLYECFL